MSNPLNEMDHRQFASAASDNHSYVDQKVSENGPVHGELRPLEIIAKLQDVYEKLLRKIDEDASEECLQLKITTLQSWVRDLGEQNTALVEAVEQLEREAAERVILLEDRIRQTSLAAVKYMNKLQEYDSQLQDFTEHKHRSTVELIAAQKSQECLQERVISLQNDVSNLLELIRRAKTTGSWTVDGLIFQVIGSSDMFVKNVLHMKPFEAVKTKAEKTNAETMTECLEEHECDKHCMLEAAAWKERATESEMKLIATKSHVKIIEDCAVNHEAELITLRKQFQETDALLKRTLTENENLYNQLEAHKKQLISKDKEIESLSKSLTELDKFQKDERAALTAEVAEKHDEIRSLSEKNKVLENRYRDATMQTHLKDDIIKQMRKDIKQLKSVSAKDCSCNSLITNETKTQLENKGIIIEELKKNNNSAESDNMNNIATIKIRTEDESGDMIAAGAYNEHLLSLKRDLENARGEVAELKLNQKSKEQMLSNQMEMFIVQQDTLKMTQKELKELHDKLKILETADIELKRSRECLEEKEKAEAEAKKQLVKAEKKNKEQKTTIKNLQEALLCTKQQLEQLQPKGTDVSVNSGRTWGWLQTPKYNHSSKMVVHDV